jgi:hypothetical protein
LEAAEGGFRGQCHGKCRHGDICMRQGGDEGTQLATYCVSFACSGIYIDAEFQKNQNIKINSWPRGERDPVPVTCSPLITCSPEPKSRIQNQCRVNHHQMKLGGWLFMVMFCWMESGCVASRVVFWGHFPYCSSIAHEHFYPLSTWRHDLPQTLRCSFHQTSETTWQGIRNGYLELQDPNPNKGTLFWLLTSLCLPQSLYPCILGSLFLDLFSGICSSSHCMSKIFGNSHLSVVASSKVWKSMLQLVLACNIVLSFLPFPLIYNVYQPYWLFSMNLRCAAIY